MKRSPIYDKIEERLDARKSSGLLRKIPEPRGVSSINLSTNSYLNLQNIPAVNREALKYSDSFFSGNLASRLISTRSGLYPVLEEELSSWKNTESALLFNSGYAANTGVLQAVAGRSTEIFSDRLNHASIIDGIRLCGGKLNRYRHCDAEDLRNRLEVSKSVEKIIVTDSVFSMDGDMAPLKDIAALAQEYNALLMVDEAHAAGIFGKRQSGLVEELGLEDMVDIRIGTLSKAAAGLGGFFAGTELLRDCFVNFSRSLIYSTALPHTVLAHDLAAVRYIRTNPGMGRELLDLSEKFRSRLKERGFDTGNSSTQIVPLITKNEDEVLRLSAELKASGIRAPAIRYPTVPKESPRIRFSLHLGTVEKDIERIFSVLDRKVV